MITVEVDPSIKVALIRPQGLINSNDMETAVGVVEPFLEQEGHLAGMLVEAPQFPGWDSFRKVLPRLTFSGDEHHRIRRVAVATDTALPGAEESLGAHFNHAQVRMFGFAEREAAKRWAAGEQ
ncbi:SpoIIAA family protein [Gilvimarinus sp. F26214L]|uniref:SpoIIAA family protein n=1 Tax=Gilvimarinus sp. DZF01 TaxID=3461371 RepID=UPI004045D54E